ncbi:MAG: PAS domain S-box protein [Nostoc sp. NOS(2021)]|uniref:PAS domain S-box protein n=1 Tax=Nostoc sp. NOS(2021) TaxID=2815407 RepID=UPI0025D30005|nr:PAS domain S-box protein [Nostoc sp. NOS(2021)]MBN3896770.1 PAS domain S-box protein [Nostoc sp. NOS(2021)]
MTAEVPATITQDVEQVLARISDAFVILDREWRYTYVNDKLAELAGMNKEDFLGKSIWEFPDTVNSLLYTELHRAVAEQVTVNFEYFYPKWHRWLENRVHPSETGVSILITDITERKRSQQLLTAQYAIARVLSEATTLVNAVPAILQSLCESLGWQAGIIWSVDDEANVLHRMSSWYSSDLEKEPFNQHTIALNEGLPGQTWASGQPVWISSPAEYENFFATAIGFPIRLGNKILGVIEFFSGQILEPDTNLLQMISAIATQIGQFIEQQRNSSLLQESEEEYRRIIETPGVSIGKEDFTIVKGLVDHLKAQEVRDLRQYLSEQQAALRDSEARYRSLAEASASIIWSAAPWGNVVDDIPTWQAFTGQSPEQYKGWGWVEALHPEDRSSMVAIWKQAFPTRSVAVAEYRVLRHDGEYRYMNIRGVPILDETGEIREWVGMCVDITDRKQAEVERKQLFEREQAARVEAEDAKEQVTQILERITDGFLAFDSRWRFTYLNHQGSSTLGRSCEDLLGKNLWEEFPELAATSFGQLYQRAVALGMPLELEDYYPPFDAWFAVRAYPSPTGLSLYFRNINVRKQAEAKLRESEACFRLLAENSTDIISRHTVDGILLYVSPACYTVLGYQPEELVGRPSREVVHTDDVAEIARNYPVNADLPDIYTITHRARHQDGDYIWLETTLRAIRDRQTREILEMQASSRDITERKQVEEEQRFLAEASGILAASLDYETTLAGLARLAVPEIADCCLVDIICDNQSVRRVAAAHADPGKQEFVEQLYNYPPDLTQTEGVAEVIRTGKSQITHFISDEQMQAATDNADHLKILQELNPTSGMSVPLIVRGRVLGAMTLVSSSGRRYDTKSLMLAEELARRAAIAVDNARLYTEAQQSQQAALRAASRTARLQAITAALSESLTPAQVAEVIVEQSMAALGASSALVALLTKSGTELEIVRAVGYQQEAVDSWRRFSINASAPLAEAVRTKQPIWQEPTTARVTRYSNLAEDYAQYNYGAWISIPLIIEGRAIGGMSLAFAEIQEFNQDDQAFILALAQQCAQAMERARLYEAEQTAREVAENANRIKDEFLAVLSHELRSPLNPILGWSKLLQTKKLDEKTIPQALKTIERNAKLQAELIEDLLDISRILQGKLSLNIYPVDLTSVISAAIETVRLSAEAKSIEMHISLEANLGQVLGDSSRLQQIVWNLLSNAVKFTPAGGRVDIRLERVQRAENTPMLNPVFYAQITVSDTGIGIDPNFLPYVFEYFRQENSSTTRKFGGLGLGLAIVRHLVELHGGTVQVESGGEDQGATFTVRLPLIQNQSEIKQDSSDSEPSSNLNGVKILVVDDDTDTREFIAFLLEQYGANVTAVTSANEALAALTQSLPDIILSDIGMPEVDGCMFMRQLRMLPPEQGGQIRAIALTAYAGEMNAKEVLTAGFDKHLAKPIEPAELVDAIANLIAD